MHFDHKINIKLCFCTVNLFLIEKCQRYTFVNINSVTYFQLIEIFVNLTKCMSPIFYLTGLMSKIMELT